MLEVPHEEVSSYGVDPGAQVSAALTEAEGLVEKPPVAEAPSNKIISGWYILQPEVMRELELSQRKFGFPLTFNFLRIKNIKLFYNKRCCTSELKKFWNNISRHSRKLKIGLECC